MKKRVVLMETFCIVKNISTKLKFSWKMAENDINFESFTSYRFHNVQSHERDSDFLHIT